jgi:uncharacterized membrane protein
MGLVVLILGLAVFIGGHAFVTRREARSALIARIGEWPYKGLFSLVSILGIVLIAWGFRNYRAAGYIDIWTPPSWARHVTVTLMWPAAIFVTAAYIPGNLKRALKHPMLAGIKLWAVAHLISNGDLGSIILFGSILAWAVYDRISLKSRADAGGPAIPVGGFRNDMLAIVVGTILYAALGLFHHLFIGVAAFGTPAWGL